MFYYTMLTSIGGKPSGKTFSQYLTQIANGVFGLTTTVLAISLLVLIYQAMRSQSVGDQSTYQDKIGKIGLVLVLALVVVALWGSIS